MAGWGATTDDRNIIVTEKLFRRLFVTNLELLGSSNMVFCQFCFQDSSIQHNHIGLKVTSQSKRQHFLRPYMSLWHAVPGMKKEFEWTNLICLRTTPKISLDWKLSLSRVRLREKTSAKKILKQLKVTLLHLSVIKGSEVYIDFLHCNAYEKHHQKQPKARWLHLGPAVAASSGAGGCRRISCRRISSCSGRKNIAGILCAAG